MTLSNKKLNNKTNPVGSFCVENSKCAVLILKKIS